MITGANGFVGSHIARGLSGCGYRLFLVDQVFDSGTKAFWAKQSATTLIEADARALPSLLDAHIDAVIHGAFITATPEETGSTPEAHYRVNVDSAVSMLAWAEVHKVKRFLFLSSAGVFSSEQTGRLTETTLPSPKGLYAVAKREIEELLQTLREDGRRDLITLRFGNLYGPDERARASRPRTSLVQRMVDEVVRTGGITVPNETARDWTFAPDLAGVIDCILKTPQTRHSLYHVVSGEALTAFEIAQKVADESPVTLNLTDEHTRLRPPLTSERLGEFGFSDWTPFDSGLAQTLAGGLEVSL
ncbi:NAD(P)-dependent oxidoreductase [soil metagenome]